METTAEIPALTSPKDSLNPKKIEKGIIKTRMKVKQNCCATLLLCSGIPKLFIIVIHIFTSNMEEALQIFDHYFYSLIINQ